MSSRPRYIVNRATKRIHDREHLTERCNSHSIKSQDREAADDAMVQTLLGNATGWRWCQWCGRL